MSFTSGSRCASPTSTTGSRRRSPTKRSTGDNDVVIAVFGNRMSGGREFVEVLSKFQDDVEGNSSLAYSLRFSEPFALDGRRVRLVLVPDLDRLEPLGNNAWILTALAKFLVSEYYAGRRISGAIYTHPIRERGIGPSVKRHIDMFRAICGREFSENVVVATTLWDRIDINNGAHNHEQCYQYHYKELVEEGATILEHNNALDSAQDIVRRLLRTQPEALRLQTELMEDGISLDQTNIGRLMKPVIEKQIVVRGGQVSGLKQEMHDAQNDPDPSKPVEVEQVLAYSSKMISEIEDEIVQLEEAERGLVEFHASNVFLEDRGSAKGVDMLLSPTSGTFSRTSSIPISPTPHPWKSRIRSAFNVRSLSDFFRRVSRVRLRR
ncbi:hypothetical protein CERSUDRAFT_89874 [Gelatoporia subvermispora B]|uniref:Uncharacterized protein n=1 Tax=Ceriporiopsis subvermispora (strain B) TaxID=914234 RepID=M2QW30_CERS8|nr:hypothetical protein CERSUDRAFT_89874 [Gelatoporia subvermispora B]